MPMPDVLQHLHLLLLAAHALKYMLTSFQRGAFIMLAGDEQERGLDGLVVWWFRVGNDVAVRDVALRRALEEQLADEGSGEGAAVGGCRRVGYGVGERLYAICVE
jgi:hypothetical protein